MQSAAGSPRVYIYREREEILQKNGAVASRRWPGGTPELRYR
jgi:hypothetical protein